MADLTLSLEAIKLRPNDLARIFRVLTRNARPILLTSTTDVAITFKDSNAQSLDGDVKRFRLYKKGYAAEYVERWISTSDNTVTLEKVNLEIYTPPVAGIDRRFELIALHCDPRIKKTEPHYRYKAAPHFHFNGSIDPMPASHISLYLDIQDEVYKDISSFNRFLKAYLTLIKDEILDPMQIGDEHQFVKLKVKTK